MEEKKLSDELLSAVTGGTGEPDITIKTLNGDNDDYSVKSIDKVNEIIAKKNNLR